MTSTLCNIFGGIRVIVNRSNDITLCDIEDGETIVMSRKIYKEIKGFIDKSLETFDKDMKSWKNKEKI